MKKKRVIALLLAATLAVGNVFPAFAAENTQEEPLAVESVESVETTEEKGIPLKLEKEQKRIPLEKIEILGVGANIETGKTHQIHVFFTPENTTDSKKLTYSSSNPKVVTVDKNGLVKAVGVGKATVTVKGANNTKDTIWYEVSKSREGIKLDKTEVTIKEGESVRVNARFTGTNGPAHYVYWSSEDESIATVEAPDAYGIITGHKPGTTTIHVERDGLKPAACKVTVVMNVGTPKLKSAANKQDGIQVTWEASKNAKNYNVYRKLPSDKSWTYLDTVKETSFFDKNVKENQTYLYTVKAKNGDLKSGYDKKGIQIVRLATPALKEAENVLAGTKLTWSKVTGATSYNVYRKANGAKTWTTYAKNIKGTSYTDKKVENNGSYIYTVRAVKNGQLSYYDTKGIQVTHLTAPKVSVKNIPGGATMSWKAIPGATGYKVYHKAKGDKYWTVLEKNFQGTSYKDTKVVNGKEYSFAVRALKEGERSYYKAVKLVHIATPTLKDATVVKGGVQVRWEAVKGATFYRVYRKAPGEKSWKMIAKTVKGLSYTDKKVKDNETYVYTVKAFKGDSYSGNSGTGVRCTYEK